MIVDSFIKVLTTVVLKELICEIDETQVTSVHLYSIQKGEKG